MEARELGSRLRSAREARGLSQQTVADALGVPRTAVTGIEAGSRAVSSLELTGLSELYLRPVADFLQEGARDEDDDVLESLYREAPGLAREPDRAARWVSLCREHVTLKRLLGAEPRSGPPEYLHAMSSDVREPDQLQHWDRKLRSEIARLAIKAYRREEISRGRVLELSNLLNIKGDTLLQLAQAAREECPPCPTDAVQRG